jgi:hypothetical protein
MKLPAALRSGVRVLHDDGSTEIFGAGESIGVHIKLRTFVIDRLADATGTSGTGFVAEGVVFSDGTVALRWRTARTSTAIYASIDDLMEIHGHDGQTQIRWLK